LNSEKRYVAGALIPPSYIPVDDDNLEEDELYLDNTVPDMFEEYKNPGSAEVEASFKKAKDQFFKWRKETEKDKH